MLCSIAAGAVVDEADNQVLAAEHTEAEQVPQSPGRGWLLQLLSLAQTVRGALVGL